MYSAPSAEFRFSAAIDGSLIQSWRRFTASSWRFVTSALIGARSSAARIENGTAKAATTAKTRQRVLLIKDISHKGHKGSQRILRHWSRPASRPGRFALQAVSIPAA